MMHLKKIKNINFKQDLLLYSLDYAGNTNTTSEKINN